MTITVYRSDDTDAPVLNGTAGSLITVLDACLVNGYGSKAAAGWTKEYSGTNLAAYRMSAVAPATGMYLRIDDTNANSARYVGFKSMTDVNTGVNQFPTEDQRSGGFFVTKNFSGTGTRPWIMIATNRFIYLFVFNADSSLGGTNGSDHYLIFGDIKSYVENDIYNCIIYGQTEAATTISSTWTASFWRCQRDGTSFSTNQNTYIARSYFNVVSSPVVKAVFGPYGRTTSQAIGPSQAGAYPDPITGQLNLFPIEIAESSKNGFRGIFPGLYDVFGGTLVGSILDTVNGTDQLNEKEFILLPIRQGSTEHRCAIQITGDWYE